MNHTQTTTEAPVPKVVADLPVNKNADTNDWDTVFAIRFKDANTAIANSWSKVDDKAKKVSQAASDDPSFKVDAVLGPWQLTVGGDGKNVRMNCPFISGSFNMGSKSNDVKGYEVIIEVGMEWVPNPDQFAFTIANSTEIDTILSSLNSGKLDANLVTEFKKHGKTLSAATTVDVITKSEDWLLTDGKLNYYIFFNEDKFDNKFLQVYQFEDSWKNNLQLLKSAVSAEEPAVVIVTIKNSKLSPTAAAIFEELLSEWFNSNIGEFNHVFSALDLSPSLSTKKDYNWIKPTGTSYAVTDNGTLDNSVFGVLTMTQGHAAPSSHQVSPNAIPNRGDVNAGFLISGTCFMKNMMLAGARTTFDNEAESSFDVTNDGLTVTNNRELTWGRFKKDDKPMASVSSTYAAQLNNNQLPDKMVSDLMGTYHPDPEGGGYWDPGIDVKGYSAHATNPGNNWYLSSPDGSKQYLLELDAAKSKINMFHSIVFKIKARQFKMSLDNSYLTIQFIDLLYPESWEYDVHINYTEEVSLGLKTLGGKQIFCFDQVVKNMTVNVTKTKASITANIVENSIMAAIGLLAAIAPVIDGLRAAYNVVEVTDDVGQVVIDSKGFVSAFEDLSEEDQLINEVDGIANGAEQVSGRWPAFKNAFTATRWKVLGGIAGAIGAVVGGQQAIEAIMEYMAKGNWEKVPAFDEFANNAILPYSWPGVDSYDLKNAALAASLQIGLKTQTKS